jgi:guanosine-3',5'-bis(diphosphate) 3'-pyrophosphohydrolase
MVSVKFLEACKYATTKHGSQKRKSANRAHIPYMVHPIEVCQLLIEAGVENEDVLVAAILHDVIEDCQENGASELDILLKFGAKVLDFVKENTDDPTLDKISQKKMQILMTPKKSQEAFFIKVADKTSNLKDIVRAPPGWNPEKIRAYVEHATKVVESKPVVCDVQRKLLAGFYEARQAALDFTDELQIYQKNSKEVKNERTENQSS